MYDEVHLLGINQIMLNRASAGILYPDHIVFLGNCVYLAPREVDDLASWLKIPDIIDLPYIIVPKLGVLTSPNLSQDGHELLFAWYKILSKIPLQCKIQYLQPQEIHEIYNWEAEKYRKKLAI
jgi:rhamnose utilization protein RhaD (predicted bifunctional aldolase and dehydrogenase)